MNERERERKCGLRVDLPSVSGGSRPIHDEPSVFPRSSTVLRLPTTSSTLGVAMATFDDNVAAAVGLCDARGRGEGPRTVEATESHLGLGLKCIP